MKSYFIKFNILLLLFGLGISCVDKIERNEDLLGHNNLTIQVVIPGSNLNQQTRATEPGNTYGNYNENTINRVDVFFYKGETQVWYPNKISYHLLVDSISGQISIPIPIINEKLFDGIESYDIYLVVNGPERYMMREKTLPELKNLIVSTDFTSTNRVAVQPNLLMDGSLLNITPVLNSNMGVIELQRAAAKIRVRMIRGGTFVNQYIGQTDGSTGATPLISVVNYNEKTTLLRDGQPLPNDLKTNTEYRPATLKINDGEDGVTTPYPIYSYANDWSIDNTKETYIMARIPLLYPDPQVHTYYYYKIPIDHQLKRIERNYLYDIEVLFNQLGGTQDDPVVVDGNLSILPWIEREYAYTIDTTRYLYFNPREVVLNGVNRYEFTISSAIYPVSFTNVSSTFSYTNNTGILVPGNDNVTNLTFSLNDPSIGLVTMRTPLIEDFLIRNISFKVTNGFITKQARAIQYPPVYITNEMASNRPQYIIHTIQQTGNVVLAFPALDENGNTRNRPDVANMVSPSFMIASVESNVTTYTAAQNYCANLTNGAYSDWRLPTTAEISYVKDKQSRPTAKVTGIFPSTGNYWSASSVSGAVVRCVRDVRR